MSLLAAAIVAPYSVPLKTENLRIRAERGAGRGYKAVIEGRLGGKWRVVASSDAPFDSARLAEGGGHELRLLGRARGFRWERRLTALSDRVLVEDRYTRSSKTEAPPPPAVWRVPDARSTWPRWQSSGARLRSLRVSSIGDWGGVTLLADAAHFERFSPTPPTLGSDKIGADGKLMVGFSAVPGAVMPGEFSLSYALVLRARDMVGDQGQYLTWQASGAPRLARAWPQTMPFSEYARTSIPAALDEPAPGSPSKKAYFEAETEGVKVAAVSGGKPVRVSVDANPVRSAFAMRWWAEFFKSQRMVWAPKADLMASLAMAAMERAGPMRGIEHPTFDPLTFKWYGAPSDDDRAVTWIWLLKYSRRFDWRRDEVLEGARKELGRESVRTPMQGWLCTEVASQGHIQDPEKMLEFLSRYLGQPNPWDAQARTEFTLFLLAHSDRIDRSAEAASAAAWLSNFQFDWSPPGLGAVAPYGSFAEWPDSPASNSAFSGSFGVTLMRAGKALGRRDLFERGVAALRASVAPLAFPISVDAMVFPRPEIAYGLGVPSSNVDGRDRPSPRAGFDATEGPIFAALAEALDEFGGLFVHAANWSVGIDGVRPSPAGGVEQLLRLNAVAWTGVRPIDRVYSDGRRDKGIEPAQPFEIRRLEGRWHEGRPVVLAIPAMGLFGGNPRSIEGTAKPNGGSPRAAALHPEGIAAPIEPQEAAPGPVAFRVKIDGKDLPEIREPVWFDANLSVGPGWHAQGDFVQPYGRWCTPAQGNQLSTRGRRGNEGSATGAIYSPRFCVVSRRMSLRLSGADSLNLGVTLEDAKTGLNLRTARPSGKARRIEWNTADLRGRIVRLRLVDREAKRADGFATLDLLGSS